MSSPLVSALASAFLSRSRRKSADLTGWRALETPNSLPVDVCQHESSASLFCPHIHVSAITAMGRLSTRTLCIPPGATSISPHRYSLFELLHILEILDCSLHFPAVDSLGSLSGVLERDSEVGASRARRLRRWELLF